MAGTGLPQPRDREAMWWTLAHVMIRVGEPRRPELALLTAVGCCLRYRLEAGSCRGFRTDSLLIFVSAHVAHAAPSPAQRDRGISSDPCPEQEEGSKITRVERGRLSSS